MQPIESNYSKVLKEIKNENYQLNEEHRNFLRLFWLLQYMRTEAASKRSIEMTHEMGKVAGIDANEYKLSLKEAVQNAMMYFYKNNGVVDDLKICLIRNKSDIDFITSDDPAVLTNRWHLIDERTKGTSFGLGTAGNIMLLPLSPRILCVGYDGGVYSLQHKKGWVVVNNKADIHAFNAHQFLNCNANIFAHNINNEEYLQVLNSEVKPRRPEVRHKINYAILDSEENGSKRYKVVNRHEAGEHEEAIIHSESIHANPATWPRQIRWRDKGFVFSNGSGIGYIRKKSADTMPHDGFMKVRLR